MAFNPFHRFRKHQKAFFAILTIICMFVFVLQIGFGRADPLTRMMDFFGARRNRGELVTTLNGVKFHESDLERLSRRRQDANAFIQGLLGQASQAALQEALSQQRAAKGDKGEANDAILMEAARGILQRIDPRVPRETRLEQITLSIMSLNEAQKSKPEKAALYKSLIAALNYEYWITNPSRPRDTFYFGGTTDPEDLLDFALWKQQADRLGIVLNATDMVKALNLETGRPDALTPGTNLLAEARDLQDFYRRINRFQLELPVLAESSARFFRIDLRNLGETELENALIDEFRVLMAQQALLGEPAATRGPAFPGEGVDQSPASFSSLEFLQFFRENRTTMKVALLDVPVAKFESKVEGTPATKVLERLFEKYKEQEPSPERDEPGFKEPRRVRIEYVTANADSPFYRKLARARIIQPTVSRIGAFFNTYAAGGGVAWAAVALSLPPYTEDPVLREYEKYVEAVSSWIWPAAGNSVHDTSFLRPENFAALVGQIGANMLSGAPLWTAGTMMEGAAIQQEIRDRLRIIAASVLAGAAATLNPLAAATMVYPFTPPILSLRQVETQMIDVAIHATAPRLLRENLEEMIKKIGELRTRPEEASKYIAKAVKDYDLSLKAMPQLKDEYAIADDPSLKDFKAAYTEASGRPQANKIPFAAALFLGTGVYGPIRFTKDIGLVSAFDDTVQEPFVYWRVQDKPAHVRAFEQAQAEVNAAWRHLEAQRLARIEAQRIEGEVRKRHSPADVVPFLREQKLGPVEELDRVSLLVPSLGIAGRYQSYRPEASVVAYPRSNFVETLLTMKKPGDSVVVRDRPEANFYVAVLLARSEPNIDNEFIEVYEKTPLRDSMMQRMFMEQRRQEFRMRFVNQMRADAGAVDDSGRFKIPPNLKLRRTDTSEEG